MQYHWIEIGTPSEIRIAIQRYAQAVYDNLKQRHLVLGCQNASHKWAPVLRREGFNVEVHGGFFTGDGEPIGHTWLEVNGWIFDPTAGQFEVVPTSSDYETTVVDEE